jgi:biotin--protein ligase
MSHQVLVYSGPGVSPLSLSHTLLTLSLLLVPNYTVQPATPELLATQPWEPACALLVIPGGRDLPFVEELSKRTLVARRIREWVRGGGRYLGLCAGAYFASAEVCFDQGGPMEVKGERELAFYKGICKGPTYSGFAYAAESGSKAVNVVLQDGRTIKHIYYNGGGNFITPPLDQIVARYETGEVAVVHIKEGKGQVLLCSVHPEYPLDDPPARDAIDKLGGVSEEERQRSEEVRRAWCAELLQLIGMKTVKMQDESVLLHPTHPSPIFVMSRDDIDPFEKVPKMVQDGETRVLRDGNDELRIERTKGDMVDELAKRRVTKPTLPPLERLSLEPASNTVEPPAMPDFHAIPKTVYLPHQYSPSWTPLFNFETYWKAQRGKLGRMVLYAETVTSTQTMLDRYVTNLHG